MSNKHAALPLDTLPVMKTQMLIRKPVREVFEAFIDPAITARIWFTKSSGILEEGATVIWEWEMYGISTQVTVKKITTDRLIRIEWNEETPTVVEWNFYPLNKGEATYVTITESGYSGSADERVASAIDSMGGFSFLLASAKALLEHGIQLDLVADHVPKGTEQYLKVQVVS